MSRARDDDSSSISGDEEMSEILISSSPSIEMTVEYSTSDSVETVDKEDQRMDDYFGALELSESGTISTHSSLSKDSQSSRAPGSPEFVSPTKRPHAGDHMASMPARKKSNSSPEPNRESESSSSREMPRYNIQLPEQAKSVTLATPAGILVETVKDSREFSTSSKDVTETSPFKVPIGPAPRSKLSSKSPGGQGRSLSTSPKSPGGQGRSRSTSPKSPGEQGRSRSTSPKSPGGQGRSRSKSPNSPGGQERSRSKSPNWPGGQERSRSRSPKTSEGQGRSRSRSLKTSEGKGRSRSRSQKATKMETGSPSLEQQLAKINEDLMKARTAGNVIELLVDHAFLIPKTEPIVPVSFPEQKGLLNQPSPSGSCTDHSSHSNIVSLEQQPRLESRSPLIAGDVSLDCSAQNLARDSDSVATTPAELSKPQDSLEGTSRDLSHPNIVFLEHQPRLESRNPLIAGDVSLDCSAQNLAQDSDSVATTPAELSKPQDSLEGTSLSNTDKGSHSEKASD